MSFLISWIWDLMGLGLWSGQRVLGEVLDRCWGVLGKLLGEVLAEVLGEVGGGFWGGFGDGFGSGFGGGFGVHYFGGLDFSSGKSEAT